MSLNEIEQIKQLLENKKNILITFQKNGQGGAIGAGLALALFLEKMGKRVEVVADNFILPQAYKFLTKAEEIKPNFANLQKFIISINVAKTGLHELSYDVKEEKLKIFITPKQGLLNRNDITTAQSDFKYDLIFVLDTADLHSLGALYENNAELFYKKPIINIDCHTNNEHFGQVNLINSTVASTGEIIYEIIEKLGNQFLDESTATAILTAIIANTHSFKALDTKPSTLQLASKLMSLGANRDQIVQNLYRTRSIATLKLWGQVLAHLQNDNSLGLAWTTITRDDFVRSGAHANDLYEIVDELISNSPEAKMTLLLYEQNQSEAGKTGIHAILNANKSYNAEEILRPFSPVTGDKKQASVLIENKTLKEAEEMVIEHIKKTVI